VCDFGCFVTAVIWPIIAKLENDLNYGRSVKLFEKELLSMENGSSPYLVSFMLVYFALAGVVLTLC